MSANSVSSAAEAEKSMQGALGRLFAIAEAYPELKANTNFQQLQLQPKTLKIKFKPPVVSIMLVLSPSILRSRLSQRILSTT